MKGQLLRIFLSLVVSASASESAIQSQQRAQSTSGSLIESKIEGAILDLLKDVSQFNKQTIEKLESNQTIDANLTKNGTIANNNKTQISKLSHDKPDEMQHVQLSSKLDLKQQQQSKSTSNTESEQSNSNKNGAQSQSKQGKSQANKIKSGKATDNQYVQINETRNKRVKSKSIKSKVLKNSVKSSVNKPLGAIKSKQKPKIQVKAKNLQKAQTKNSFGQKKANFKKVQQKNDDNQIVQEAMADAKKNDFLDTQMSSLAAQQQDQLDNIDQVLGEAQLQESKKSKGGKYAKNLLKSAGKPGQPDPEELDMMDGDMLEESQTMGDSLDQEFEEKSSPVQETDRAQDQMSEIQTQQSIKPQITKNKAVSQHKERPQKRNNRKEVQVHAQNIGTSANRKSRQKNLEINEKALDQNLENDDIDQEEMSADDLDGDQEMDAPSPKNVKVVRSQLKQPIKKQIVKAIPKKKEQSAQNEEDDLDQDLADDIDAEDMNQRTLNNNKAANLLKRQNELLMGQLNQCKVQVKNPIIQAQGQHAHQGMAQQESLVIQEGLFGPQKIQLVSNSGSQSPVEAPQQDQVQSLKIVAPQATPAQKVQMIFKSNTPTHQKILEFTKQYCLPELIDSKELRNLNQLLGQKDQQNDVGARDLIPYICFYNGLGMLEQKKKNPDMKIEAPKDLLIGFKKKRDFIMSLRNGHHKSIDQCQNDLKKLFNQTQGESQSQALLSNQNQQVSMAQLQLDTLMPFQEKYHENAYLNIYQYFCKKQIKINQPSSSDKTKVFKPEKMTQSLLLMYTTGLELQQKLDKITDYDQCNEDTALMVGIRDYCIQLFKDQQTFYFWGQSDLKDSCVNVQKTATSQQQSQDKCAILNEAIFTKYKQTQASVLSQVVSMSHDVINKKRNKELQLKQFVEDADDDIQQQVQSQLQQSDKKSQSGTQDGTGQQTNKTQLQSKDLIQDPNSFEHSILSLVRKFSGNDQQNQDPTSNNVQGSQYVNPGQDSLIEKYQDLNVKTCQMFQDQFQDSNNQEIASACDYVQVQGQSLVQQKAMSIVTLQDHSQRIYNALNELQQNYVRCQNIPACNQRMDQTQQDNFANLQQLSQEFLKDGFIQDHSDAQISQSMFAIPAIEQDLKTQNVVETQPKMTENRPNSTLEQSARYIRSLQDEKDGQDKKQSLTQLSSDQGSLVKQNTKESGQLNISQQSEVQSNQQPALTQNLSNFVQDQVNKMFQAYVAHSEQVESEQEKQMQDLEQERMSQLSQMVQRLKNEGELVKVKQHQQMLQQQSDLQKQALALKQQQMEWQQQQEQMARQMKQEHEILILKEKQIEEKRNKEQQFKVNQQAVRNALSKSTLQSQKPSGQLVQNKPSVEFKSANSTLEQTISQALLVDVNKKNIVQGAKQQPPHSLKKHKSSSQHHSHKHSHHVNQTYMSAQPANQVQNQLDNKITHSQKNNLLALPQNKNIQQPPIAAQPKKLAQISSKISSKMYQNSRKQQMSHKALEDQFEKDLIQEEVAMNQQVQPMDDSQLMLNSLQEGSILLGQAAGQNNIQQAMKMPQNIKQVIQQQNMLDLNQQSQLSSQNKYQQNLQQVDSIPNQDQFIPQNLLKSQQLFKQPSSISDAVEQAFGQQQSDLQQGIGIQNKNLMFQQQPAAQLSMPNQYQFTQQSYQMPQDQIYQAQ